MLENGVILASFADKFLNKLNPDQLDQYDRLINLPTNDWDIYYWATKTKPTPVEFETPVMKMLREHLHSKVSNEDDKKVTRGRYLWKNKRPDDIMMPASKPKHNYDVDVRELDLVNYQKELFDHRIKTVGPNKTVQLMTQWRRDRYVRRLKRVISSPVSLRNMTDSKEVQVATQRMKDLDKEIAKSELTQTDLIDTNYERTIKHHNFLQHLLSSKFTTDVLEYEDEALAWAEIAWHRRYGSADVTITPSPTKCVSCQAKIHCCDHGLEGYMPKELFSELLQGKLKEPICQRCKFFQTYNAKLSADINEFEYTNILNDLRTKPSSIVVILIDLTDFPNSIYRDMIELIGKHHKIIIVGNKLDLLPYDAKGMIERVTRSLRNNIYRLRTQDSNLYIDDIMVISAKTGFRVEGLVTRILSLSEIPKDLYILGSSNSGKSTLFNALLQSDLCAIRGTDLLSRVSVHQISSDLNLLKFPINLAEAWEAALKRRKAEIVERNTAKQEQSFRNTTKARQKTMPHMSMLIDCLDYNRENLDHTPLLSDDHPMKDVEERPVLSASRENYPNNSFCHKYPSVYTHEQLHGLLTEAEKLETFPYETIIPRKYSVRPLQSIFIAGLARLDLVSSTSNVLITVFASKYLPIHVIATKKADQFYNTFLGSSYLGVPFGDEERIKAWPGLSTRKHANFNIKGHEYREGAADVVFSSAGWALINVGQDRECIVRAYTPEARGIFLRSPPLLAYARRMELIKGRKIRDTPLFVHPHYEIDSVIQ